MRPGIAPPRKSCPTDSWATTAYSTTGTDGDFIVKLIDVYPPSRWYPLGYALNLTDSIMRLRYRNGYEKPERIKPGEVVELTMEKYDL